MTLNITDKGRFFSGDPPPGGSEFPDYEPGSDRPPRPLRSRVSGTRCRAPLPLEPDLRC